MKYRVNAKLETLPVVRARIVKNLTLGHGSTKILRSIRAHGGDLVLTDRLALPVATIPRRYRFGPVSAGQAVIVSAGRLLRLPIYGVNESVGLAGYGRQCS